MSEPVRPKTIITGHASADYDALASMVAAHKLYPEATLIAPSMLERQSAHPFLNSLPETFSFYSPKDCDLSEVTLLVVVDTRQTARIAHVAEVLDNPGLEIHVYDHHPDSAGDLSADRSMVRPWGSTTTIIAGILKEKGLVLSPDEATLLGLGIFEDTGSFTFDSTTEHDFAAAGFLRSLSMDLTTIADLLNNELTTRQVHLLGTLLRNAVTHTFQGIPVTVTEIVLEEYVGDFATLVHKLMDMESLKVVFTLAAMGDRVQMIARSRLPDVDVRQICASFGGGGHSYAAAASIKNQPLAEIRAQLLALLVSSITPQLHVGKHMTSPAIAVTDNQTISEAVELMNRFGLKAVPVLKAGDGTCVGLLEQQTATRAATHKLGDQPVTVYMQRGVRALPPDADIYQAMEIILKQRQRLVPVMENGALTGVLTRTDILRLLVDETLHIPEGAPLSQEHSERDVSRLITDRLPPEHVRILRVAGALGDDMGYSVFAVGGFVRDLILKHSNLDIDLSVEGDGLAFAKALAEQLGGRVRTHQKFRTAIVFYEDEAGRPQRLDVATARLEYYEYPAALPTVELSSIKMDLYRRDFTINALAVQLNQRRFGALIDPFGAQRDIKEKSIAVLHSLSFVEDPTRILRAVRFERRFEFRINMQTERLVKNALSLGMLSHLSGSRLFHELVRVFDEKEASACIRRLEGWDVWKAIHPLLKLTPEKDILLSTLDEVLAWYRLVYQSPSPEAWMIYLLGLCITAKYPDVSAMLERLGFIERARTEFLTLREQARRASSQLASRCASSMQTMSSLYDILSPIRLEGLLFLMARHGQNHNIGPDISLFLTRLRGEKLDISGEDLVSLGETPGPLFGETLRHVLREKLDGNVFTRKEQLALASRYMAKRHEDDDISYNSMEVLNGRT